MADNHKQLIQSMFQAIPEDQRVLFLREMIDSLTDADRRALLATVKDNHEAVCSPSPAKNLNQKSGEKQPKAINPEREFEQFVALSQSQFLEQRADAKRQMVSCLLIGVGVIVAIVVLGYGIGKGWAWISSLFGAS
ncbi:MAG: hypothetical protein KDC35_18120 [Acidobacteria bacterium]|nr:hypothetical protein [Acidobacteriota bacterium]